MTPAGLVADGKTCRSYSYPSAEHFCGFWPGHSGDHYCPTCRQFWARSLAFAPQAEVPQ